MVRVAALLLLVALAATACGSSHKAKAAAPCPAAQRALVKIQADLTAMRHARTAAAISHLTDRFLLHLDTAPISNLQRNRLIDHAAAAVLTLCPQCFQALEADRPIPAIAAGENKCGAR